MIRSHSIAVVMLAIGLASPACADSPVAACKAIEGGMIECWGGFSDGAGAVGVTLDVISYDGTILIPGKLDAQSKLHFQRPEGEFYMLFDAGPGHVIEIDDHDIKGLAEYSRHDRGRNISSVDEG